MLCCTETNERTGNVLPGKAEVAKIKVRSKCDVYLHKSFSLVGQKLPMKKLGHRKCLVSEEVVLNKI